MRKNLSPWLHQLDKTRESKKLATDLETDVAIVGAGIAGVATAFFTLKYTDKRVVVLDRFKLAHGATGHNAGQIVSYFERGFASLVEEFGLQMAAAGEKAIEDSWELLAEIYTDAELDIPFSRFVGHAGLINYEQVLYHLKNNLLRREAGIHTRPLYVSNAAPFAATISPEFKGLYTLVRPAEIRVLLETDLPNFIGVLSYQKGCINSALFCQEAVTYLARRYGERFQLFEHTSVDKAILRNDHAVLDTGEHTVTARRVVLCTNGFEYIRIFNQSGLDIDARYHHLVSGTVGYMSGYLEKMNKPPIAVSYYMNPAPGLGSAYYYLTRRPYEYEKGVDHNLISVGGQDTPLAETSVYSFEDDYPEEMEKKLDEFIHQVYSIEPNRKIDYVFTWHGLMGYTRNGVRLIGPEPQNKTLLYNLGCNGVGILPSLYGGRQVSRFLAGERVPASIFDVPKS